MRLYELAQRMTYHCRNIALPALLAPLAHAAELDAPYPKVIFDQAVGEVMTQFAQDTGLLAVVSAQVDGNVAQTEGDLSIRQFLNNVTGAVNATWYYSGGVIYVDPVSDVSQRVFDVSTIDVTELTVAFRDLGLDFPQLPMMSNVSDDILILSGPNRFLSLATDIVVLKGGAIVPPEPEEVEASLPDPVVEGGLPRVFRGRVSQ